MPRSSRNKPTLPPPAVIAAAAAFAAAELAVPLLLLGFLTLGRAEAALFFVARPLLLLIGALWAASRGWPRRLGFYALALLVAACSETLLLLGLGNGDPWPEMLRGLAAGAVLALVFDLVLQLGRRLRGRLGQWLAAAGLLALLAVPQVRRPYEALVVGGTAPGEAAEKPALLVMSGLPLVWGEGGAFDPESRPAEAYSYLEREFAPRPIDSLEPSTLEGARLLLLAQPRLLAPEELVALDAWVRGGGRTLILTDPRLVWRSEVSLGDPRRPPALPLLGPLLGHWGLRLDPADEETALVTEHIAGRRLTLAAPGRFVVQKPACRTERPWLARCRLGEGEALLVADADLLHDSLWAAPGGRGAERHLRLADNPLVLSDWLDGLAGLERDRAAAPVQWVAPDARPGRALLWAALPLLLALACALALRFARRR